MCAALAGMVAMFNVRRNYRFLHNRSMPDHYVENCVHILEKNPIVSSVHDVKSVTLGADRYRFKAEIILDSTQLCRLTIDRMNLDLNGNEVSQKFLEDYSSAFCLVIGDQIDEMERQIQQQMPEIQHLDIEPV